MKPPLRSLGRPSFCVAPHAGAWIETRRKPSSGAQDSRSPPTRGRGLKHSDGREARVAHVVAPHAGAWIETNTNGAGAGGVRRRPPRGGVD